MSDRSLDMLFWRPDLATPDVTIVLEIASLVERMMCGEIIHCPSTLGTALIWRKDWPGTVSLVRRDLLSIGGEDLYEDMPSFFWHDFPMNVLERAVVTGFDEVLIHRSGENVSVMVGPNEHAPGWLSIDEFNQYASGYVGLGLVEPHEGINVPTERITDFLAAVWKVPVP
ncbi:hypothetical protein ACIBQ1_38185 [Nonomuraea sp. NPDC050153]|uniref:hypothetical protein n=1 Tax=Nonomuraea sp. NPDC050153 TaxID=3364359 RepID=UPI00379A77A6